MPLAADIVARVSRRLVEHAGLELPAWVVEARTLARIAALAVTPEAYVELIATARGASELRELVEIVRVGESSLFRHRSQIAALADVVAPALRARGRRTVRVWSAGCASGEEPYTLALVLARALPAHSITIIATDVSDDALEAAQRATYPSAELADVPEEYRESFSVEGDCVRVRSAITQLVRFERANLLEAPPPRSCDVVWCRNVLIYFSVEARRRAIERLVAATVPGGYMFVGYSESLREITELDAQRAGDAVFYVKRGDWSAAGRTPVPEPVAREKSEPGMAVPRMAAPMRSAAAPGTNQVGVAPLSRTATQPALPRPTGADARRTPRQGVPLIETNGIAPGGVPLIDKTDETVLTLTGAPAAAEVQNLLGERLAIGGLRRLTIDLDAAVMLEDELALVIRRACAAARGAGVDIVIRATRTGAKRWVSRHGLDEVST